MKKIDRLRFSRLISIVVLLLLAAGLAAGAGAANSRGAVVKLGQSKFGRIVVGSHGRTLYVWAHDKRRRSTCYGKCARAWPPLVTRGKPRAALGARRALLGTTLRRDGRRQVTYHGHPLYYFAKDRKAGQTLGAGLTAFGGRWDPVSAAGIAVKKERFQRPKLKQGVLNVVGTAAGERIALRLKAGDPDVLQVDVGDNGSADFSFKRKQIAKIAVDARAGDDLVRMDESNGAFTSAIPTTIAGGIGNDTLAGGAGAETLLGGDGNDTLDGNGGNDRALLGAGDDTFVWDPGDGSDTIEGEAGADTMRFNGANIAEQVDLSANGNRLRFFRTQANITMDTAGIERVDFNALGGPDVVIVGDLTGTDVGTVNLDLASTLGAAEGDGQVDRIIVEGTNGGDRIHVNGDASGVVVAGLRAVVAIRHQEATDALAVDGVDGNDDISAAGLPAQAIALTLAAGSGDDEVFAGQGDDKLLGGDGNDTLDGSQGNDVALMGAGDDTFVWDPGDGSDTVEGEAGDDSLFFIGANIAEQIDVLANGNRVRFVRDIGNVTMDTAGLERIDFQALGGADLVNVGDLTGTDLAILQLDLQGAPGGGDGAADRIVINGTDGDDAIDVSGDSDVVKVSGLAPTVQILHSEFANDRLEINTLDGIDTVGTEGLEPGAIQLLVDGVPVP
jgi:predicted lipoprotein with Yx(FWY)xxD motif/Ca2+-binding RTX toxin-like protein